jgi:hypothetical protein
MGIAVVGGWSATFGAAATVWETGVSVVVPAAGAAEDDVLVGLDDATTGSDVTLVVTGGSPVPTGTTIAGRVAAAAATGAAGALVFRFFGGAATAVVAVDATT